MSAIVALLVEAEELRALGREWRRSDPRFSRIAYRLAANRLAALRRGDVEVSRWYVVTP